MKTEEDEAFDDIARKQGMWGGGFTAKRQAAMDKINTEFREEYIKYRTAFPKEYTAPQPAQEQDWKTLPPKDAPLVEWAKNQTPPQPAQEPVAQGSKEHLKIMMEHSAWDDRLELSDALANIDEFYATTPPKREWVGLTDEEMLHIGVATGLERAAVEMISNKLKDKNNG